jgi:enoyl-CoA hydratase
MPSFTIERTDGIARLELTRPEASNALDREFWSRLAPELRALDADGGTRVLVISGQGRNFCAGLDLAAFAGAGVGDTATPAGREAFAHMARDLQQAIGTLEEVRFPTIAAVQGACVGAGLELIAACDVRVASACAYFRIEEINIGMMADLGSLQRLPRLLPDGIVRQMAFLGTTLGAEAAGLHGFVTSVEADTDALMAEARAMAQRVASKSPLAIAASKQALNYARDHTVEDGLRWAALAQSAYWNMDDIMKALQARATKGTADFAPPAPFKSFSE